MKLAKSDRLGLVAFAGSAFLQCPLTVDDTAFHQSVDALDVNIIPQGGTALAEAIETALQAFKEGDNYKVLVLFTDGEDHDSGALDAAKKGAEQGLQIFTIGIGSPEGSLLRITDAKGRTDYIRDEQGNVVNSHLNEGLLREIASATPRGFYLPLRGVKTIDTLYEQGLAPIPKSEGKEKLIRSYHEKFYWPLSAAILLLLAEIFFPERKREPKVKAAAEGRQILRGAPTILLLVLLPVKAFGSPASALREYEAGKYDQALKEYEELLQRKGDDPRLHFNAGAAAYRNRQFEAAAKQFNEALAAPDLRLQGQAYYNRGNSLYHLGESAPDDAKKMETWQKSLQDYQSALKLNQQDADAKFNYQFVKQKLEELKQQQQKQNQKDNKDQDKDQNKEQQQANKDQQKQDPQKQDEKKDQDQKSQAQQDKSDKNKESAQQNQQSEQQTQEEQKKAAEKKKQDEQKQAEQKQKEEKERKEQEAQQASGKPKDASDEKDKEEQGQAYAAGQMTPEQAKQLLDAQKGDENMLPIKPTGKPVDKSRPVKDW
jgi:Ca-activated chloride channel family protein